MKYRSAYERALDKRAADSVGEYDPLMCTAHSCPNRWSVDSLDKGIHHLCSAHAWSDSRDWPQITQAQLDHQLDHQIDRERFEAQRVVQRVSAQQKVDILHRLKDRLRGIQP